ncbi:uncharacterized protein PGTG_17620 [Puccinia graminis f. sp. tritici CRL 75-36-700-3]|uniref:Uncharacterized protein n=1 Tax=Puccinia graminis f. sp. tritici (strain CRL 75-36-700-3 / race SCCL) TaxID=418459 RepID=E3L4U1_PUCGT|nr:uncharacterized protein PGTG_17620 [Puccinia graminis f. sp. tritici CRL 75-36-700-3]EFP91566.1 hypothetical protein PGTG_17620 [Puccinia graminis f. sp. tritici CRL 75-36-700-3]
MFHWNLSIRSFIFVADPPRLGPHNKYRIFDATPWTWTRGLVEPIYHIKLNVSTPAPMELSPKTRSWLAFEGSITGLTPTGAININTTRSNYYTEIPADYRHANIEICGHVIRHEFENNSCCTVSIRAVPDLHLVLYPGTESVKCSLSQSSAGQTMWISGFIIQKKHGTFDVEVKTVILDQEKEPCL